MNHEVEITCQNYDTKRFYDDKYNKSFYNSINDKGSNISMNRLAYKIINTGYFTIDISYIISKNYTGVDRVFNSVSLSSLKAKIHKLKNKIRKEGGGEFLAIRDCKKINDFVESNCSIRDNRTKLIFYDKAFHFLK